VSPVPVVRPDDLSDPAVHALLEEHLTDMYATSPAESVHALDLDALRSPDISFFTAWDGPLLLGCGGLRDLGDDHLEIKSMRAARAHRGRGTGRVILQHLLAEAERRSARRVSLETGVEAYFAPARSLYARHGFVECPPFGDYVLDPNSVFMTLSLTS
jgi:putative acetyltransferase